MFARVEAHVIAGGLSLVLGLDQGCAAGMPDTVGVGDGESVGSRLGQAAPVHRAVITGDMLVISSSTCSRRARPLRLELWNRLGVLDSRRIDGHGGRLSWPSFWSFRRWFGSGHGAVSVAVVVAVAGLR